MPAKNFEKMLCTALKDNKGSAYATCLDVNELIQRQPDRYKKKCFAAFLMLSDRKLPNKYAGEDSNDFYMWYLDYTAISAIFAAVNPVLSDAAQNMIPQDELIDRLWAIYCNSDLLDGKPRFSNVFGWMKCSRIINRRHSQKWKTMNLTKSR